MKIFKFYLVLMAMLLFLFTSCNKEENISTEPDISQRKTLLTLGPVLNNMLNRHVSKQELGDVPECSDATPAYAQLSLTYGDSNIPVDLIVEILSDENGYFTAYNEELEIPIPSGANSVSVNLTDFLVWSDIGGSPGDIIWAAPKTGSEYAVFVDQPLPITWDLGAGSKTYVDIPVVCFDERQVNLYGYLFFDISTTEVSTLCFFANYCTQSGRHYPANYSLNLYLGTSSLGIPIYLNQRPTIGIDTDFYADPLCLAVPSPPDGMGADEPYLYYEITLLDWPNNYGTVEDYVETGTFNWNEVQDLLNNDGTTSEYKHIYINCGETDEGGVDTYVLLTVDTENINENNLNETVFFTDNRTTIASNSSSPENHIALVDRSKNIFWSGTALNLESNETIEILEVYRKSDGGVFILERTYTDPDLPGVVIGDIRSDFVDGFELYSIVFKIVGETERTFIIDPKLKMIVR